MAAVWPKVTSAACPNFWTWRANWAPLPRLPAVGLRLFGSSWAKIAFRLGTTSQAARQRWGRWAIGVEGPCAYPVTVIVYVTFWLAGPNVGVPDSVAAKVMWWIPAESGASMM